MARGRSKTKSPARRWGRRLLLWAFAIGISAAWRQAQLRANEKRYGDAHRPRPH